MNGDMVPAPAFSNGTEFMVWQANYCDRCFHDRPARRGDYAKTCQLPALGLAHIDVPQWVETDLPQRVHCVKFTPDDGKGYEGPPRPKPTPPGQTCLIDPTEYDWDREQSPAPAMAEVVA